MYGYGYFNSFKTLGGGATPVSYLVDDYSPAAAYSLRKLSSTATNCIRVRRSSDNTEQDIGFSGVELDASSLTSFVGANDGFVVKWYNQGTGGATYDATQSTAGNQHRIVTSGTIETVNSKYAVNALTRPPLSFTSLNYESAFTVAKVTTPNTVNYLVGFASGGILLRATATTDGFGYFDGSGWILTNANNNQHLGYLNRISGGSNIVYVGINGSNVNTSSAKVGAFVGSELGGRSVSTVTYLQGFTQEVILFGSDQAANKTAIESNINSYYAIY